MPLPNPAYLSQEFFNWDGSTKAAVLLATSAVKTDSKRHIRWDACDMYDRERIHGLLSGYNDRAAAPVAEASMVSGFVAASAYHTANYNGTVVGGNPTGLATGVDYSASVVYKGVETVMTINGTDAATFTTLLAELNTALPVGTDAVFFDGNIEIVSTGTGLIEVLEVFDGTLFVSTTGFNGFGEVRNGVTTIEDVFDLNFANFGNNQTYAELLIGRDAVVPNTTLRSAKTTLDQYFNHGTETWLYVSTTSPV